jgi:hypothetical protein
VPQEQRWLSVCLKGLPRNASLNVQSISRSMPGYQGIGEGVGDGREEGQLVMRVDEMKESGERR